MRIAGNYSILAPSNIKIQRKKHSKCNKDGYFNPLNQNYSRIDIENSIKNKQKIFENFLSKKGKVSFSEYCHIKKNHPEFILKSYKYLNSFKRHYEKKQDLIADKYMRKNTTENQNIDDYVKFHIEPKDAAKCALCLKQSYDNDYGKDNYRVISVGTSPAFITQIMPSLGCEVIYLPISNISQGLENASRTKLAQIGKYLLSKGVDNNKTNIILDYVVDGGSIYNTERIIKNLGIKDDKIQLSSLFEELADNDNLLSRKEIEDIFYDIAYEKVDNLSNVPHFDVQTNGNTLFYSKQIKDFEDFSKKTARAFSLCAFYELEQILNKKNPRNTLD